MQRYQVSYQSGCFLPVQTSTFSSFYTNLTTYALNSSYYEKKLRELVLLPVSEKDSTLSIRKDLF